MKRIVKLANWIAERLLKIIVVFGILLVAYSFFGIVTNGAFPEMTVAFALIVMLLVLNLAFAINAMYPPSDLEDKKQ